MIVLSTSIVELIWSLSFTALGTGFRLTKHLELNRKREIPEPKAKKWRAKKTKLKKVVKVSEGAHAPKPKEAPNIPLKRNKKPRLRTSTKKKRKFVNYKFKFEKFLSDLYKNKWKDRKVRAHEEVKEIPRAFYFSFRLPEATEVVVNNPSPYQDERSEFRAAAYKTSFKQEMPIVFDTGASMSVTPLREDFEGDLEVPPITSMQGLKDKVKVIGVGKVSWTVFDMNGITRTIKTRAYLVPDGNIRLLSPQTYFQENGTGSARVTREGVELVVSDGTRMMFPYNTGSNLPLMLTKTQTVVGLARSDTEYLADYNQVSACLSVVEEVNQNLTSSQKELSLWHQRLGHANFQWVQWLASTPRDRDEHRLEPILPTKQPKVSSCTLPLCAACQIAKQARRGAQVFKNVLDENKDMMLKRDNLKPGDMVSIDQYYSAALGRLPNTKGKESKKEKFCGGTLFVDHASSLVFLKHQISLRAGDTVISKKEFERKSAEVGVRIKGYHADNVPFDSVEFRADLQAKNQTLSLSGTGAHHQNGIAERAIRTVVSWARAMMLNSILHWPSMANLEFWPFALEYAAFIWNNLPSRTTHWSPNELFSSSKVSNYDVLTRLRVWGCPVYVLDPALQDGKKIPKWKPRARRGMFLGFSEKHSSLVGKILNIVTGHVNPQYHVVYDEKFSTVTSTALQIEALNGGGTGFTLDDWNVLITSGYDRNEALLEAEIEGTILPELDGEWLSPAEIAEREDLRKRRLLRRNAARQVVENQEVERVRPVRPVHQGQEVTQEPDTVIVPELDTVAVPDIDTVTVPTPRPNDTETVQTPTAVVPDGTRGSPRNQGRVPVHGTSPSRNGPMRMITRTTRRKNKRVFGDEWANYQCYSASPSPIQKIRASVLNNQYLQTLTWEYALEKIRSNDLRAFLAEAEVHINYEEQSIEWWNPYTLAARANAEDNPSWEEAMNGPEKAGYWEAMEVELDTLENKKDSWEVIEREPWMNVLPSTWAFKCKRFPDGSVRKLKARFCVRGDRQVEGVDFFDTYAPVVNWQTVRLMLVLSVILELSTKQVDYTAAFVHAPIDKDPNWDNLTEEQKRRSGVYVCMPRGFSKEGKVLKLKKSLYGLKQAPRNFFQHLKGKLEAVGFRSHEDLDACLFVSDKVICLVYVDDTLFYSPRMEYIDEVIEKLRQQEMDLEVEGEVSGFLGVHIERNEENRTVTLTQTGLTKRIIEALGIEGLHPKRTPATAEPLVKDEDGDPPDGEFNYSSVIGMLQYLQNHSRPDITYAVSQCARFVHSPRRSHEQAIIRIGQYLKGTLDKGIIFKPSKKLNIECYVDADFAGLWPHEDKLDLISVKSRTGFVVCLSECPVIWGSKLQGEISTSTMEAEYNALSSAMRELLPFKHLVEAIATIVGYDEKETTTFKTTIWEDNVGALTLARMEPGRVTPRSKHYAVKTHWFRSKMKPENIVVEKVDSEDQKADIMTKGLRVIKYEANRKQLSGW